MNGVKCLMFLYFETQLKELGYSLDPIIIFDEIQAYLATEPYHSWDQTIPKKYQIEFEKVFYKYYNN
jgi:hypothetical protein